MNAALDYGILQEGKLKMNYAWIDISEIIDEVT